MSNPNTEEAARTGSRRVLMTLGGGGQLYAANRIAQVLDPVFDLHFVTSRNSRTAVYRDRTSYLPALQSKSRKSRLRTYKLTLIAIAESYKIISHLRPDAIVGVQGASAFPLMLVGSLFRAKRIYIETFTRPHQLSLTARLLLRFHLVDRIYVQWPQMATGDRRIVYKGTVL